MKASDVTHGFDMAKVKAAIEREDWEDDIHGDGSQVRRLYLGSVFGLTPSGKYYLPFACSNLTPCETCKGSGRVTPRRLKRRTVKKQAARHARLMRKYDRLNPKGAPWAQAPDAALLFLHAHPLIRTRYFAPGSVCTACCGSGSREAHLDELWRLSADAAFEAIGLSIEAGDGDPCDLFAVEYRDNPDDEDDGEGADNSDEERQAPGYGVWNGE